MVRKRDTLEKKIVLLNDQIQEENVGEVMLARDMPPVLMGTSFAVAANAMAVGFE